MSDQAISVKERLFEAGSPRDRQYWETEHAYYVAACRVSPADIPQLIELACKWSDPDWPSDSDLDESDEVDWDDIELLPITAWRTLAELKCSESVEPLIGMLCDLEETDDWSADELPHVFGLIGKPAIEPLVRLANDDGQWTSARGIAANALRRVAEYHPQTRTEIVTHLSEMMTKAPEREIELNSSVLSSLVELRAVEAAELIERAFSGDRLDVGLLGDWDEVRQQLGVEGLGLKMPKHPHNSIEQIDREVQGIGIFSEQPVFGDDGIETEAEHSYYERAWSLFSKSKESEQVIEACGELQWVRSFLDFGIHYRSEVVDVMTVDSVGEFLLDFAPRKISTEPESAESMILELTKFWEYVQREFDLPEAKSIVEWLSRDGLVDELRQELADPANFGMAKSIFMSGMAAGYDMTSQQGLNEFMVAFNRGLIETPERGSPERDSPEPVVSRQNRVGRNEPCPCGSGKKYKKCCLRNA